MLRRQDFKTPNVIDLGERAPSAPSRDDDDDAEPYVPRSRASIENIRDQASALLERGSGSSRSFKPSPSGFRGRKIPFGNTHTKNPQGGEEMLDADPELPVHDELPSVEQARMFAAAILDESEKQESKRKIFDSPSHGSYRDDEHAPLASFRGKMGPSIRSMSDYGGSFPNRTCYRFLSMLSLVALVIVLVFAIIAVFFGKGGDRMDAVVSLLSEGGISDHHLLTKRGTPQHTAANWLANLDLLQVDVSATSLDHERDFELIQRYTLAVLYFALNGDQWTNKLKFTTELHECSWFHPVADEAGEVYAVGVTCNEDLRVTNLLIPGNNAEGTIPDELAHLSQLDFLSLKHNHISRSIPSSLQKLTKLNYLDFKFNELTGTVPAFIGNALTDLKVLGLSNNQMEGSIPMSFGSLDKLRTLAIGDNLMTGSVSPISKLTNLEYLYAENNSFDSHLDGSGLGHSSRALLDDLTKLIEVDLSKNDFKSIELPTNLFTMPSLRALDLSHNKIEGRIPADMDTNGVLEFLSLRGNLLRGPITSKLTHLEELIHLDLEDNDLTGIVPEVLFKGLTSLKNLFLGKNPFDAWPIHNSMAEMSALKELSLDNAHLTGSIPSFVSSEAWQHLEVLDLRNNNLSGSLPDKWHKVQNLSVLLLNDNELTGAIPVELTALTELGVVSLHHNGFIAEAGGLCLANDETALDLLTTDCGAVTCDCCKDCCDSEDCYSNVEWDDLGFTRATWEEHFQRADYSFNPHIVATQETRR